MNQYINCQETPLTDFHHLLVGDLSGIQDFIFNTQSEGAAKTLKARSYYVQAVSEIALEIVDKALNRECLLFYNGGGNFYVFCRDISLATLNGLRKQVQQHLADHELYLSLSAVELKAAEFGNTWKLLHQASSSDKLNKFGQYFEAFEVVAQRLDGELAQQNPDAWKDFVKPFTKCQGFKLRDDRPSLVISEQGVFWGEWFLQLSNAGSQFKDSIVNKLPTWDTPLRTEHDDLVKAADLRNRRQAEKKAERFKPIENDDIVEFEVLGQMAQKRTGTDKIAVLKMDADNLGKKFLATRSPDEAKTLSDLFKKFFDETMFQLWQDSFPYHDREGQQKPEPFRHNIYPVFSGGDDCMFIGGWDAVFEFAKVVQERFATDVTKSDSSLTLSASLTMFDSKYPVVRLAQLSEEALKATKKAGRNRISVFGTVLTWPDFATAYRIAKDLEELIKQKEEPRGILERIKLSHRGFAKLQDRALDGRINNPALWRLFYFIRKGKNLAALEDIIRQYEQALLYAAIKNQPTNPAAFPIAARWAEFLTR